MSRLSIDRRHAVGPTVRVVVAVTTAALVVALTACGGPPVTEPAVPSIDVRPAVVLHVDDDGLHWSAGTATPPNVSIDPTRIPHGALLEIRNDGDDPHRLRAGKRFDTGILQPGDTTLVLFDEQLPEPRTYTVEDVDDPALTATFEVLSAA